MKKVIHVGAAGRRRATLPLDFVTETAAILARRGGGKTYTGNVLAEGLLDSGHQVVVIDPLNAWWGLRSSADGRSAGYPIVIFGGSRGDLPLDKDMGGGIADLVAENPHFSCVLSLRHLSKGAQKKFVTAFASRLFDRKGDEKLATAVHIFLDEADIFCLTEDTEILTNVGWKRYDQLKLSDEVSCFDLETQEYCFEKVQRIIVREHNGEMIHLKTEALDCLVTPDHRVVLQREQRAGGRNRKRYPWSFCKAGRVPQQVRLPIGGASCGPGLPTTHSSLWQIMGWVISDGSIHDKKARSTRLCISQGVSTTKLGLNIVHEMDAKLLRWPSVTRYARTRPGLELGRKERKSVRWYLGGELSSHLLLYLGCDIHRIPRVVLERASRDQLELLFLGLMQGDGTSKQSRWVCLYVGHNEGLADDFQELCTRLGIRSRKTFVRQTGQWNVRVHTTKENHYVRKPKRKHYSGIVWDVTVPTGAFVARRKGTVFVTGNCPQQVMAREAEMVGAVDDLVRRGRQAGIGVTMITQRSAALNKNVLSQAELLIAGQITGAHDKKAILGWIVDNADVTKQKEFMASLAMLQIGQFWFWSPRWLQMLEQVDIRKRNTFDSSATPKPGRRRRVPKKVHAVDLKKIKKTLESAIETAEQADPKALRRRIVELELELRRKPAAGKTIVVAGPTPAPVVQGVPRVEVARLIKEAVAARDEMLHRMMDEEIARFSKGIKIPVLKPIRIPAFKPKAVHVPRAKAPVCGAATRLAPSAMRRSAPSATPAPVGPEMPKCEKAVLGVLFSRDRAVSSRLVALQSGYSVKSSSFANALSSLRMKGWITGGAKALNATNPGAEAFQAAGGEAVEVIDPSFWSGKLRKCERAIFEFLLADRRPRTKDEISEGTGYSLRSSSFANALSKLRGLQLIEGKGNDEIGLTAELFG